MAIAYTSSINIFTPPQITPLQAGTSPAYAFVGTSVVYNSPVSGLTIKRSNGGVAMTDTLLAPGVQNGDIGALPNGYIVIVNNIDATAAITITPTLPATINGTTTLVINAGTSAEVYTDGVNYFSIISSAVATSFSPVVTSTGSPKNLGTFASGSTILRSNATVAMADTLPNANTLPNGWYINVINTDASASDTITPATSTIDGAATLVVAAGLSTTIHGNGVNYFATTPA